MSSSEKRTDDLVDRLLLDIKALELLHGSEAELKKRLEKELVDSHDESVARFVSALQKGEKPKSTGLVLIAVGELALASLLVLAGAIVLAPTFVGISTPGALVQYFAQNAYSGLEGTPLGQYVSFIEFAIGAVLMVSAFYTLRQAALNLRQSGFVVKPGE